MDISNRKVLVTGASRGIGRAMAKALSGHGAHVIITATNEERLKDVCSSIENCTFHVCDVSNEEHVRELAGQTGEIDILINNAGVAYAGSLADTTTEEYDKTMDVNVRGVFLMSKHFLPNIRKGGIVVNVSSGAGKQGFAGLAVYCASKFAVIGMTESFAAENKHIKAYALCPGATDTDMYRGLFGSSARMQPEDIAQKLIEILEGEPPTGTSIEKYS